MVYYINYYIKSEFGTPGRSDAPEILPGSSGRGEDLADGGADPDRGGGGGVRAARYAGGD